MGRKKINPVEEANGSVAATIDFDNFEDIVPIEENIIISDNDNDNESKALEHKIERIPTMEEAGWTEWVLSQFEPQELDDGLPKVDGLRRLVRKLIGPIIKGKTEVKQVPTIENEQRATVEYTIVVLNKYRIEDGEEPYEIEYTDAADAYRGNVKGLEYARFPTAMAGTRAEVRALRKALNLGVVGSEEISDQPLEEAGLTNKITENQITKIDIKCQQLDINVMKFVNLGRPKPNFPLRNNIDEVSHKTGVEMYGLINLYQQEVKPIPDSIKGYEPNWRGVF